MVNFLCGCSIDVNDSVLLIDDEGFVNCPNHPGYRRYGWRSIITTTFTNDEGDRTIRPEFGLSLQESEKLFFLRIGVEITKTIKSYRTSQVVLSDDEGS